MGCSASAEVDVLALKDKVFAQKLAKLHLHDARQDAADFQKVASSTPPEVPGVVGNCFICLPESAVHLLGLLANMSDKAEDHKRLWFGRAWQLRALSLARYRRDVLSLQKPLSSKQKQDIDNELKDPHKREVALKVQRIWRGAVLRKSGSLSKILEPIALHHHVSSGTVIFMHGSGGMTYNNVRYVRKLAGMGFVVIGPDSMAGGEFRHRDLASCITPDQPTPYWDDLGLYKTAAEGEFTYNTSAEAVVKDPAAFQKLYENVFRLRSSEMHWILKSLPLQTKVRGVYIMGQSEGAMTVARFDDRRYGSMIRGRIISAFSVEYCYFTPTREAGTYGGNPEVATLNIIGDADQYFGPIDSVALSVAGQKDAGGWGADNFTGNGFKEMKRKKLRRGLVAVLEGAKHDASETHDNFLRELLRAFLESPDSCHTIPEQWDPDPYLREQIELLEVDSEDRGFRVLVKVKNFDEPKTSMREHLLMRTDKQMRRGAAHHQRMMHTADHVVEEAAKPDSTMI